MLEITKEGTLKTQIMYRANLSYTQLSDYLNFLLENNLVVQTNIDEKEVYTIAPKGLDFLQTHRELVKLIGKDSNKKSATI